MSEIVCPVCGAEQEAPDAFRAGAGGMAWRAHRECRCGTPLTWWRDGPMRGRWRVDEGAVRHRRDVAMLRPRRS